MTGTSVSTIHSGLLPEWMKASMIFSRLASFLGFSSVVASGAIEVTDLTSGQRLTINRPFDRHVLGCEPADSTEDGCCPGRRGEAIQWAAALHTTIDAGHRALWTEYDEELYAWYMAPLTSPQDLAPAAEVPAEVEPDLLAWYSDGTTDEASKALAFGILVSRDADRVHGYAEQIVKLAERDMTIGSLQSQLERARTDVREAQSRHERDMAVISEVLMAEAESRSWCSQYDAVVEEINSRMSGWYPLETREREYVVTYTVSIRVTASDADCAQEEAESDMRSASSRMNYNVDYSLDQVELDD